MPLTERQLPFTGPYGLASGPFRSKGPTAEALKRFFGRLGYLPWSDFDQHYNKLLGACMVKYKKKHGLPADPSYGQLVWAKMRNEKVPTGRPNAGEYCFDFYSRKIIQDEAQITAESDDMAMVQRYIREFWLLAIANEPAWHYSQARKFKIPVDPKARAVYADCSATPILAVRYAGDKAGVKVVDPSKNNFSGYGNTDLYEDDWPKIGSPYRIGDLAHFHSERHVIQCIKEGTQTTAQWASHGREAAPELIGSLASYYRFPSEFMFVVRPDLIVEK